MRQEVASTAQPPHVHHAADLHGPHLPTDDVSQTHAQDPPESSCAFISQQPLLTTNQQAAGVTNGAGADERETPHIIPAPSHSSYEHPMRPVEMAQTASEGVSDMVIDLTEATPGRSSPASCAANHQDSLVASLGHEEVQAVSPTDDLEQLPASAIVSQEEFPQSVARTSMEAAAEAGIDVQGMDPAQIQAGISPAAVNNVMHLEHKVFRLQRAFEETEGRCQHASDCGEEPGNEQLKKRAAQRDDLAAQNKSRLQHDLQRSWAEQQRLLADDHQQAHKIAASESSIKR